MIEVVMPKAGQTVEEGTIVFWSKSEGEAIEKGDVLAEIETDKAVFELESPASGVLLRILQPEGAVVPVFARIALLGQPGEDADKYLAEAAPAPAPSEAGATTFETPEAAAAVGPGAPADRTDVKSSPAARRAARDLGIDLAAIGKGSGPGGLITAEDVERAAKGRAAIAPDEASSPGAGEPVRRALTKARRAIAANLSYAKQNIPHFYMKLTVDAAPLEMFCRSAGENRQYGINDVILLASARAMREFPEFRSRLEGDEILEFAAINIGVAVSTKAGLVVPAIVAADEMTLNELGATTRRLVEAARAGKVEGIGKSTFTVTNLGMFGVEEFAAIINPPESAILAVGAIRDAAVASAAGVRAARVMTLVLSADHRIVDGATAAKFTAKLKNFIENPAVLSGPDPGGAQP